MLREALSLDALLAMEPDDAAAIYVARRAEGLTPQEDAVFAEWLRSDAAGPPALARADRAWSAFRDAEGDEILDAMRERARVKPQRRQRIWYRAAAAAAVVLLAMSSIVLLQSPGNAPSKGEIAATRFATLDGRVRNVTLPDGSRMTLDAGSVAIARFAETRRTVELVQGGALFDVKPAADRPFAVRAGGNRVVAIGTRFEIMLADGPMRVWLIEGRVAVEDEAGASPRIELRPGQQFIESGAADKVKAAVPDRVAPGWSRGLLEFDDRPLAEAAREMNRYSGDRLLVRDPRIAALRVSGQFRAGEAARFADTLAEIYPVRVVRRENAIELVPAP